MGVPETLYVKSDDVHIAYEVVGDGPVDLVFFGGTVTNCELIWEEPSAVRFLRRLAGFSRHTNGLALFRTYSANSIRR